MEASRPRGRSRRGSAPPPEVVDTLPNRSRGPRPILLPQADGPRHPHSPVLQIVYSLAAVGPDARSAPLSSGRLRHARSRRFARAGGRTRRPACAAGGSRPARPEVRVRHGRRQRPLRDVRARGLPAALLQRDARARATAVAGAMAIARLWDAINDPLIGSLSDNCRSRFGRRRPFLLAGAVSRGWSSRSSGWCPRAGRTTGPSPGCACCCSPTTRPTRCCRCRTSRWAWSSRPTTRSGPTSTPSARTCSGPSTWASPGSCRSPRWPSSAGWSTASASSASASGW